MQSDRKKVRIIFVGTFAKQKLRSQVFTSLSFVQSWLVMRCSVTLTGPPSPGLYSKLFGFPTLSRKHCSESFTNTFVENFFERL